MPREDVTGWDGGESVAARCITCTARPVENEPSLAAYHQWSEVHAADHPGHLVAVETVRVYHYRRSALSAVEAVEIPSWASNYVDRPDLKWKVVIHWLTPRPARSRRYYLNALRAWFEWCEEQDILDLLEVAPAEVARWLTWLQSAVSGSGHTYSPATINLYHSALAGFYEHALSVGATSAARSPVPSRTSLPGVDYDRRRNTSRKNSQWTAPR